VNLGKVLALAVVVTAAAVYSGFLCLFVLAQGSLIYPGTYIPVNPVAPHVEGAQLLKISTTRGNVEAIFLPALAKAGPLPEPVMIFGHGNGEIIDYWLSALHGFQEHGVGVLLVEYPGYGRSTGSPSEESIRAVMDAAYDRIAADPRVDRTRIFGFGQSLGGGAICLLAKDRPLRALILQSTFTSLDTFAARYWMPSFVLRDHFDNLSTAGRFRGPVLVIHGRDDPLIPWQQGARLAEASTHSTFKLYNCEHMCWDPEHLPFWQDAVPFLRQAEIIDARN